MIYDIGVWNGEEILCYGEGN